MFDGEGFVDSFPAIGPHPIPWFWMGILIKLHEIQNLLSLKLFMMINLAQFLSFNKPPKF